jgi:hypothetical protein
VNVRVFLHGFEISTQSEGNGQSPFEIQLLNPLSNVTGVIVQLSVTTETQILAVLISYVVYQNDNVGVTFNDNNI